MGRYFSQFGKINRLRLSRSKKTGKPKGYGWIEFEDEEVARIAVATMNKYIIEGRILKCVIVEKDALHPKHWKGADRKFFVNTKKHRAQERKRREEIKDPVVNEKVVQRLLAKEKIKKRKLAELGIDYDFPGYSACVAPTPKRTKFEDNEDEMKQDTVEDSEESEEEPVEQPSKKKEKK
eukprot:TRINITY_DN2700_c0_g1_i5.p1 TRINITY_DN2700_c0_g1~~TRINITY_DN2700_c0_g1_i5.p1  ORF type:complete len:179 (-),score=43.85 TRINITY_DN2700_c0_g1_i5:27-563(-)